MELIGNLLILLHLAMVGISGGFLVLGTNLNITLIITIFVGLTWMACIYFDGCITTKAERELPLIGIKATELVKRLMFVDSSIQIKEIEKILIGLTFAAYLTKSTVLFGVNYIFNQPLSEVLSRFKQLKGLRGDIARLLV